MADDLTLTSTNPAGPPNSTKVVTDEHPTRGHMQVVKLGYSADGDATYAEVDSAGLLVKVGTGAAALGKAEDAAHVSGDTGVGILTVRRDTAAATAGTDGDYQFAVSANDGAIYTRPTGLPVLSAEEDGIAAFPGTGKIMQGTTARTPTFLPINTATSGDNTLVAAAGSGNKIRVLQVFLMSDGTVDTRFESGAGGTALTGQVPLIANIGYVLPFSPIGWFETAANTLLNLELSGAVNVHGVLAYVVVT